MEVYQLWQEEHIQQTKPIVDMVILEISDSEEVDQKLINRRYSGVSDPSEDSKFSRARKITEEVCEKDQRINKCDTDDPSCVGSFIEFKGDCEGFREDIMNGTFVESTDDPIIDEEIRHSIHYSKTKSGDFDAESEEEEYNRKRQRPKLGNDYIEAALKNDGGFF